MNKETQLEVMGGREVARSVSQSFDVESIFRLAIEKGGGVETIERLMAIRREMKSEAAKEAYDAAMAAFQAECPVILKTKGVSTNAGTLAYKYAPLENIIAQVAPTLQKHGFSFKFDTDVASVQGWVIAKCIVTHAQGHSETSTAKFPMGTKTQIMSETQVYASALTFASRRVFCNAFGLVTAGEDTDGATGKPKPAGPSTLAAETKVQDFATELWDLLKGEMRKDPKWNPKTWQGHNNWLWKHEILDAAAEQAAPHLSPEKFKTVIAAVKARLA